LCMGSKQVGRNDMRARVSGCIGKDWMSQIDPQRTYVASVRQRRVTARTRHTACAQSDVRSAIPVSGVASHEWPVSRMMLTLAVWIT